MKTIKVLLHRVAVKPLSVDDWDDGRRRAKAMGLELAPIESTGADKNRAALSVDVGEVLAIGSTAFRDFNIDIPIEVGNIVTYVKGSGKLVTNPYTKEECVVLNDEDFVAVLDKE
jgi:co-chaperonin GroES (HSP10)